ncbi:effector-associated constant component EACC1 [Amycolatopsis sp. NPDC005003]
MQARLSCDGTGSVREAQALADWLKRVDELRGSVKLVGAQVQPGRMGGISDVVGIALGGGGAVTVLIRSVFAWLGQRAQGTRVLLDIEKGDGRKVHLELTGADDSGALIDRVVAVLSNDSAAGRAPHVEEAG